VAKGGGQLSSFSLAVTIVGVSVGTFSLLSLLVTVVSWARKRSERSKRLESFKQQEVTINESKTDNRSTDLKQSQEKFTVGTYVSDPQVRSWVDAQHSARQLPFQTLALLAHIAELTEVTRRVDRLEAFIEKARRPRWRR
jgi:hypothetical protein